MERKKATDFPQELLNLFDLYVHGWMSRREFLNGAQRFAVAGASAGSLFEMLRPNYAWAIQVQPDDKRIRTETVVVPSLKGSGSIRGYLARPANDDKLPGVLVIHENRGLNPYIEDVSRRLAIANFIAFAPDGLTSVGGYPRDDEKAAALFKEVDQGKMKEDFLAAAAWLKSRPDSTGKIGAIGFCFGGSMVNALALRWGPISTRPFLFTACSRAPKTRPGSRRRSTPSTANSTATSLRDGRRSTRRSRRRACRTRAMSTRALTTASTTTRRRATTKPQPGRRGDARSTGSTDI
jgi:dienelactone hydrolase